MIKKSEIYKRLYKDYSKKYLDKILISAFFSILVAGSTSSIAWLLDPAIKKLFIERDQSLIFFIPISSIFWEMSMPMICALVYFAALKAKSPVPVAISSILLGLLDIFFIAF